MFNNKYEWLNKSKSRFYTIVVEKHVSNDIVLHYQWGSCVSNRGGTKKLSVKSETEVQRHIKQMMTRRSYRGYELISHA